MKLALARSLAFCLAVGGTSVLVACGGTVEHSPQTSAAAATKAPVGTNTHGLVKVVGDALGEVALRPEQRTEIEKLVADAEARHAPMADARKELMIALAEQIEKGTMTRPPSSRRSKRRRPTSRRCAAKTARRS